MKKFILAFLIACSVFASSPKAEALDIFNKKNIFPAGLFMVGVGFFCDGIYPYKHTSKLIEKNNDNIKIGLLLMALGLGAYVLK